MIGYKIQNEETGELLTACGRWFTDNDRSVPRFQEFVTDSIENCCATLKEFTLAKGYYNLIQVRMEAADYDTTGKEIRIYFNGGKPRSIYE